MKMENTKPKKQEAKKQEAKKQADKPVSGQKLAVIQIRNITKSKFAIRDTLSMLRIQKKFTCTIVPDTESIRGMLNKVKDYVTYGEIDNETLELLTQKRGKKGEDGMKKHFHLCPPRGGFERKGIKHAFEQGGALGYRKAKINDLIKKML